MGKASRRPSLVGWKRSDAARAIGNPVPPRSLGQRVNVLVGKCQDSLQRSGSCQSTGGNGNPGGIPVVAPETERVSVCCGRDC
jgi:hypothetical protein